jgi:hypothetical protein
VREREKERKTDLERQTETEGDIESQMKRCYLILRWVVPLTCSPIMFIAKKEKLKMKNFIN